jgi:hypothetical protein
MDSSFRLYSRTIEERINHVVCHYAFALFVMALKARVLTKHEIRCSRFTLAASIKYPPLGATGQSPPGLYNEVFTD